MTGRRSGAERRHFFAHEVVQTSSMDCGPASLKCLLEGFGISISYPRLQEACQTDIDGTSINVLEQIAVRLGLDAQQIMLPVDHLLLRSAQALPALLVTSRAGNTLHFLVVWRRHGSWLQVMDPAKGRRWLRAAELIDELYVHAHPVPAAGWRTWAGSDEFLSPFGERLAQLGITRRVRARMTVEAATDPGWRGLATLDAATRMVAAIAASGAIRRGADATRVWQAIIERSQAANDDEERERLIPSMYWSVRPDLSQPDTGPLWFHGAVLVRIRAVRERQKAATATTASVAELSQDLAVAVRESPYRPLREVARHLRADGLLTPGLLLWSTALGGGAVLVELLLLRAFLEVGSALGTGTHRLGALAMLIGLMTVLLVLDVAVGGGIRQLGRRLETRLRLALLEKLPRMGDRYFRSRLVSDMALRVHGLFTLRALPDLGSRLIRSSVQLIATAIALAWMDPLSGTLAAAGAACAFAIPFATQPLLAERELRTRNHAAALSRFYLDSLLGLVTARTHGAERSLRRGHEALAVEWGRASLQLLRSGVVIEGVQSLVAFGLAALLVLGYIQRGGNPGGALLLIYWAMSLPGLGRELASTVQRYSGQRNTLVRLLEPLGTPDETAPGEVVESPHSSESPSGVAIVLDGVNVCVSGREILRDITLAIAPGEHVAVVGRSGAGKSSLAGLFLGWHRASSGEVLVDGEPLRGQILASLRAQTAWIDPAIQLWNRSLFENLRYGVPDDATPRHGRVIEDAALEQVLESLPEGLQSQLGEGGALTSGGEGQRVRFGRALGRHRARFVLMDEPFRGLDRRQRQLMLGRARACWREATLLCVTHDIGDTQAFDRVIVLEAGRIVEDGHPIELAERQGSAYARMLDAERALADTWSAPDWRRLRIDSGSLVEDPPEKVPRWTVHHGSRGL